jgi:hypothetical protein
MPLTKLSRGESGVGQKIYNLMKRVFVVHRWDGKPGDIWYPWLKAELEKKGFEVHVPTIPKTDEPRIKAWVPALAKAIGTADAKTFLVGHSIGCQTIARYLASLPENVRVGGAVFVAGFFKRLTNLEDDDVVRDVAKEWLTTPLDLQKVRSHLPKSVAIFSDNDKFVPLDEQNNFQKELGSKIIVEHEKGHFDDEASVTELPIALHAVLKITE